MASEPFCTGDGSFSRPRHTTTVKPRLDYLTGVLAHYHLAGGFATPSIIVDPSGQLTELQAAVSRGYAGRQWVHRRCEHAKDRVLEGLARLDESEPFHDQVIGWLFPTGVTAHVLLVAGMRNPTVRRRYVDVREVLAEYRQVAFYETLLELVGCARMSRTCAEHHLAALTEVFDIAKVALKGPFSFASDISDIARPLAIAGSRDLIPTVMSASFCVPMPQLFSGLVLMQTRLS